MRPSCTSASAIVAVVATLTLAMAGCDGGDERSLGALEVEHVVFAPSLEIEWAVLGPDSSVLLGARDGVYYATHRLDGFQFLGAFGLLDVVGAAPVTAGFELVDARTRRILTVDEQGILRGWRHLDVPGGMSSATKTSCGWLVVGSEAGETWVRSEEGRGTHGLGPLANVTLTSTGPHIVATEMEAPFRMVAWRCDRPLSSPRSFGRLVAEDFDFPLGVVPGFAVGGMVVRTLADMGSDLRVIQVFSQDGRSLQDREMDMPMGLVAATCSGRVLAVRRFESTEIAIYRWRAPDPDTRTMC